MKILLINANPVVSRLLSLCTRNTELLLDEVTDVDAIQAKSYDLIFVDDGSYVDAVNVFLAKQMQGIKVFISYHKTAIDAFDETIQKPFLPSQIIKVIERAEKNHVEVDELEREEETSEKQFIFPLATEKDQNISLEIEKEEDVPLEDFLNLEEDEGMEEENFEVLETSELKVLDGSEIEKIKALLEMDDIEDSIENLSEDEVQLRKVEVIKEQLISEGLEILDEDEIIDELSNKAKEKKSLKVKKSKKKEKKEQKKKQDKQDASKEVYAQMEAAVTQALSKLSPKKRKKFLKGKTIKLKIKPEDAHS